MLKDTKLLWLIGAGVLVAFFLTLSFFGLKLQPTEAIPVFGLICLIVGYRTLWEGIWALFTLNFSNINLLMLIAVIGGFVIGEYEEAAVVIVLFTLAERLEFVGIRHSQSSLDALVDQMPKYAYLKGMDEPFDITQVNVGDIIIIKPHHVIPLDGVVIKGDSYIDEASITGEPIPRDKRIGDDVFAGTFNKQGVLEVRVTRLVEGSTVSKIREMTYSALKHKAHTQRFIETFSSYYTPAVITLALFWMSFSWLGLDQKFIIGFKESLTMLVISCPCALVISTPISIFSAIGNASNRGILIKGGRYLEAMGQINGIAFDKTRTLTRGEPIVTDVIPYGEHTRDDLLSCAAGVELFSEHPLAQSIVEAAKRKNLTPHDVEKFESVVGKGAKAECLVCSDRHHCIGKLEFILEEHVVPKAIVSEIEKLQSEGKTAIVISSHSGVKGVIAVQDELRQDSMKTVKSLKKMGIPMIMLTGDQDVTGKAVGQQVGISEVKSELLPVDKAREVKAFKKKYGTVAMVGDGVNDAPALASADVGISMTTLSGDVALEASSIVILNNRLSAIPYLIRLGKRTLEMIQFNTVFAVVIKFLVLGLALVGGASLAAAIFADVGVTLMVIFNSLRLLKFR